MLCKSVMTTHLDMSILDGLMSYSIPDGHQMIYSGMDVFFNDSVYDGASAERSEFNNTSRKKGVIAFLLWEQ